MKHTPPPWSQGITLLTPLTAKWSAAEWQKNNNQEKRRIFAHFIDDDEGRSRKLVALCTIPEDAELIVRAVNCHEDLLAALKIAKRYMVPNEKTVYGSDMRVIEEAIAAAEGKP